MAIPVEALAAGRGEECEAKPGSLRWNARQLLVQGDVQSIKELADRLDGKATQEIDLDGRMSFSHEDALNELE